MTDTSHPSFEHPPEPAGATRAQRAARALYKAIADGRMSEALQLVDPGVVIEEHPALADSMPLRGHAGLVRLLRLYADAFGVRGLVIEEIAAAGDDAALVRLRLERDEVAAGREPITLFHVAGFGDGKLTRIEVYRDRSSALRASAATR